MVTKTLLTTALLLSFCACTKTVTPGHNNNYNTITINDDGAYFTEGGVEVATTNQDNSITIEVVQHAEYSMLLINNTGPHSLFSLSVAIPGPQGMSGVYTSRDPGVCHFKELFSGGISYEVDSCSFNIGAIAPSTVNGDFQLWVHNNAGKKHITGTISGPVAVVH